MKRVALFILSIMLLVSFGSKSFALSKKSYIIAGTTDKITSLDPAKAYEYFSDNILQNIMGGLVNYIPGTTKIVPDMAKSWKISKDGLVYTFKLRKGLKFSNGDPIDAEAFAYSIMRVIRLKQNPSFLLADVVKDAKAVDKLTLKIRLKYPYAPFISILAFTVSYPVDPKVYPKDKVYNGMPVASGPYMIKKLVRGQEIELVRNPNYYGKKAKTPTILIKIYREANNLYMALKGGEIELAYRTLLPQQLSQIQKDKNFKTYIGNSPFIREVVFNVKAKPFNNPKLREALSYAIDRGQIVKEIFKGQVSPLYTLIPSGMWGHKDVMPHYNMKVAVRKLKALGYTKAKPLTMTLWYSPSHYGSTESDVALMIKNQLEKTGLVKCTVKYAEWATYVDYWTKGVMGMFLLGWYPDYFDPDDYMWPFLQTSASPGMGSFFSNKAIDKLLTKARTVSNTKKRAKLYYEVQKLMVKQAPYIPLFQGQQQIIAKPNIKGVLMDPVQIFRYYLLSK